MTHYDVSRIGAKFESKDGGTSYHPLACHMLDVAAVTLALWDECLPESTRVELAVGLGLVEDEARLWVAFLAGLHDLGKASRPFQGKYDPNHAARLAGSGLDATTNVVDPGHGLVTAAQLPALFATIGVSRSLAVRLAAVLGGHHGAFVEIGDRRGADDGIGERDLAIRAAWDAARSQMFEELRTVLKVGPAPAGTLPNAAVMLLGGLVSVADWIGSISDEGFFEYAPEGPADLPAYFEHVRDIAKAALAKLQWTAYPKPDRRTFQDAFGWEPRALQECVDQMRAPGSTPAFVVIEAPMGEGKTEAALHLLEGWTADGLARGFYVALPTQATANQVYRRTGNFLRDAFAPALDSGADVNLVLAHGGAWLQEAALHLPAGIFDPDEQRLGWVAAGEWFLKSGKRALLAPYGVGTIDQSLMAVLQVKHVFVRLFGLAGKAVVIDEVHAYDTYMTELLERLLEWLGALHSPVVLLSATLPTARRRRLAQAYRRCRGDAETAVEPDPAPYPRITWDDGHQVPEKHFPATTRSVRALKLRRIDDSDEAVRDLLVEQLNEGGCAVVICNTVHRAQVMHRELAKTFPHDEIGLFHARFVAKDRQRIENDCLTRFGPDKTNRPHRFVLVATQVVEQSLDVDFDLMVTDFAPADLLLQRSGRLQRHEQTPRPPGLMPAHGADGRPEVTLHVRWPQESDSVPAFERDSTYVYDEHVLVRTWHALRDREAISIPEDIQDLVDQVYREDEGRPRDASAALAERWATTWEAMGKKKDAEILEAEQSTVRTPAGRPALPADFQKNLREEDSPDLHPARQALTRLAAPNISVVLLPDGSKLAPAGRPAPSRGTIKDLLLQSVSISSRRAVRALAAEPIPDGFAATPALRRHRLLPLDANGAARVGDLLFRYDSELGLEVEGIND